MTNLAKYLDGQLLIGVNGDPARNPGILVPHTAADAATLLARAASGPLPTEARTMIWAELEDGQALLALNKVFVGHASHQSARYSLHYTGREEAHSSSGLIVASGTSATGWALSIGRATGVAVDLRPDEPAATFLVREPRPSQATGVALSSGRLAGYDILLLVSRMTRAAWCSPTAWRATGSDFTWGRTLQLSVAARQLRFLPAVPAASSLVAAAGPTGAFLVGSRRRLIWRHD